VFPTLINNIHTGHIKCSALYNYVFVFSVFNPSVLSCSHRLSSSSAKLFSVTTIIIL